MAFEMMVGLTLSDEKIYQDYRNAMAPLLKQHDGGFRFDFVVSKVLQSESDKNINRVFAIYFKDRDSKDAFFSHPDYKVMKANFFERSVKTTTIIAEYERP